MQEITLSAGALKLTAVVSGPPDGPPVLALHGWMDNAASFQPLAGELTEYRMVALELPGHGGSDSGGDYFGFMDNLSVIHQALEALGWRHCMLLGHSMGGGLASSFAALFPELVKVLISVDSYGPMSLHKEPLPELMRKAVEARRQLPEQRVFADRAAAVAARVNANFPLDCAQVLALRGVEQTAGGWTWRGDRRLKWPSITRLTEEQAISLLAAIRAPHLVLRAAEPLYPQVLAQFEKRLEMAPPSQVETVPGGHHFHMQQSLVCADLIRRFAARRSA